MYRSVYDIKTFYNSPSGKTVQRVLQRKIAHFWPDLKGMSVMGCGYATPYLGAFSDSAKRIIAMMPARQGAHHWPEEQKNLVFLSDEGYMPIANSSVDRVLLVHNLESCDDLQDTLREVWRVLKANGRVLVIVPNRTGLWAQADWSPFGHGSPFSLSQLCFYLRDNLFVQEQTMGALFVPPLRWSPIMRSSPLFEYLGKTFFPIVSGIHMVEASKQLYAGVDKTGSGSAVFARTKALLGGRGKGAPVPQNYSSHKFKDNQD